MELSKEMQERVNRGRQQRAEFRKNKKYCDRRIADHILACIKSEMNYQTGDHWMKWIDIHEVAKSVAKHSKEISSLYGDYFENGRITRGEAEIRQFHDLAHQLRPEGFMFQYGLLPTKTGKKHLAILIRKSPVRDPKHAPFQGDCDAVVTRTFESTRVLPTTSGQRSS